MLPHALQRASVRSIQVLLAALFLAPLLAFSFPPKPASTGGMAVAGGTVTSATGTAMPGVTVDLYAWPSDAVQKALKPGQLVPTTLLATAITSRAGKYTLTVPVAELKAAAVESGYANLEISSAAGGFWFFPYQTTSLPARPAAPVTADLSSKKTPVCGNKVDGFQLFNTGFVKQRELKPAWAVVGQGYIAPQSNTKGDTVAFNYVQTMSATQTSTLGIGISGYGINAGYNTSGSNESVASEGVDYPKEPESSWFRTQFSVGQFRSLCVFAPGVSVPPKKQHGKCPRTHQENANTVEVYKCLWLVKSTGWFGPVGTVQQRIHRHPLPVPHTPASFCGPEGAGITAHTNKEKAIQWSSGFEIGGTTGIKGVTLNASYGSTAQLAMTPTPRCFSTSSVTDGSAVPIANRLTLRYWSFVATGRSFGIPSTPVTV